MKKLIPALKLRAASAALPTTGIVLLALLAAGCSTTRSVPETAGSDAIKAQPVEPVRVQLVNTRWKAVSILGKPARSADSTMEFPAEGQVAGNTGCNRYNGGVQVNGASIEFGLLASTKMFCEPSVNGQEIVFLEALTLARSWERSGDVLELLDDSNAVVLRLETP